MIEFMEMIFPHGPREVKRIIIRSATDPQVHKLKEGKLTFYQGIIHKLLHVLNKGVGINLCTDQTYV